MYRMTVCNRIALFLLASVVAFGETRTKGMIKSRTGETLIVSSAEGNVTVVLTDDTRTKDDKGLFGLDKQELSFVVLIPGLKVDVEGVSDDQGRVAQFVPSSGCLVNSSSPPSGVPRYCAVMSEKAKWKRILRSISGERMTASVPHIRARSRRWCM